VSLLQGPPESHADFFLSLLQSESDEALEVAVTQVFREFGSVWVKIRRDAKHMPFAFCQYSVSNFLLLFSDKPS
jgi:hypothetical protein